MDLMLMSMVVIAPIRSGPTDTTLCGIYYSPHFPRLACAPVQPKQHCSPTV